MTTLSETTQKNTHTEKGSASPVAETVTQALHQSVDTLGQHAAATEEKIRDTANSSAENLAVKQQQAKSYWDNSAVGKYTKENPVATAGIAFAAGMLLASFIKSK